MGLKRIIREKRLDPCDLCKHYYFKQVDQFGYEHGCKLDMPTKAFYSGCGCYMFKKRKKGEYNR